MEYPLTPQQEREQRRRESLGLARAKLSSLPSRQQQPLANNSGAASLSGSARHTAGSSGVFSPAPAVVAPSYRSHEVVERRRQQQEIAPANDMILAERYSRYESSLRPDSATPNKTTGLAPHSSVSTPRSGGVASKKGGVVSQGAFSARVAGESMGSGGGVRVATHVNSWNRSFNPTDVPCSKSPVTTSRIMKASKDTLLQLERSFNDLVAKRQHCDRASNACLKEYSVLSHAVEDAEAAITHLNESFGDHEFLVQSFQQLPETVMQSPVRSHESAMDNQKDAVDPHRRAFRYQKPSSNNSTLAAVKKERQHYGHHSADSTVFVGLNDTNKALRHGDAVLDSIRNIKGKIDGARQLLEDTAVASQKTQHMSLLIETAMNVDLICMGKKADEGHIAVSAAPTFPNMKLDDFDAVIQRSTALTTYCTRVADDLRKVVVSALAGHSEASKAIAAAMRLGLKCAATKREEALRQADFLHIGKRKCLKDLDDAIREEADVEENISRLTRIKAIRSTAAAAAVFGSGSIDGSSDPVMYTLGIQLAELQTRMIEIQQRKERLGNEVGDFDRGIDEALRLVDANTADQETIRRVETASSKWF